MTYPVDHLKENQTKTIPRAYGRHIGSDVVTMSYSDGTNVTLRQALSDGEIEGVEGVWYEGTAIDTGSYTVYPGTQISSPASPFELDNPHTGTVMLNIAVGVLANPDNRNNTPNPAAVLAKFLKIREYNSDGVEQTADFGYSVNGARVSADLVHFKAAESLNRNDWNRWTAWRDFMAATETVDYSTIPGFKGIGLTGKYYSDSSLSTLVETRIDPVVYFASSVGAPAMGIPANNFSVRWEGKIKSKGAGVYTISCIHDDGVKVWIDNLTTPIIDEWSSTGTGSATITLAANTSYNIKVEYKGLTIPNGIELRWTPPAESSSIIPQEYLYPNSFSTPRYETHALFASPVTPNDALRHVLALCNSIVQQADGKRKYYCLDELTEPGFDFDLTNIKQGSFKFYRRDQRSIITRYEGVFRNLDSRYLETANPSAVVEYPELQNDGVPASVSVSLDSMTYWQALKVLTMIGKRETKMDMICEFDGTKMTYPVLPGDLVTVTHPLAGLDKKLFLVLETIDYSPETTPDRRGFTCLEWTL